MCFCGLDIIDYDDDVVTVHFESSENLKNRYMLYAICYVRRKLFITETIDRDTKANKQKSLKRPCMMI